MRKTYLGMKFKSSYLNQGPSFHHHGEKYFALLGKELFPSYQELNLIKMLLIFILF